MGVRTPYGLAFSPSGELWEVEHGPFGGDELNLIEKGKNYGWPLVSYGKNYNGVPIPNPDTRPDLAKPVLYWVPVIAPGNLMFYHGTRTFPQWNGNGFIGGLGTESLNRIIFDGHGGARAAERWKVGHRIRDVEEGSRWLTLDAGRLESRRPDPCDAFGSGQAVKGQRAAACSSVGRRIARPRQNLFDHRGLRVRVALRVRPALLCQSSLRARI